MTAATKDVGLRQIAGYFLRLGTLGFGGPIALAATMQRDLVERRGWITQEEYLEGLAAAQTLPGPLAAQLAMWLGYTRRGFWGATAAALAFILPPFVIVMLAAAAYVALEGTLVVGFASAVDYVHPDKPRELWINEVGVAPSHQRQGLGQRLLRAVLDHGQSIGCRDAWVLTSPANGPAVRLYESVGGSDMADAPMMFTFRLNPGPLG